MSRSGLCLMSAITLLFGLAQLTSCDDGPVQTIDLVDANGVTMAAVQALHRELRELRTEVARLRSRLEQGRHGR